MLDYDGDKEMARKSTNGQLEEAIAVLINNQSSFLAQIAQLTARADDRFHRIESELAEIKAILLRHEHLLQAFEHMLQALPEAVREKIGFAPPVP
jgi:predicted component of type VI protein secretion system